MCSDTVSNPVPVHTILIFVMVRKKNFLIWKILHFFKTRCKKGNYFLQWTVLWTSIVCVNVMTRWESVGLPTMDQTSRTWISTKLSVSPTEGVDQEWDPLECKRKTFLKVYFYTVESSLFMGDQCSWFSLVTLAHKFTSQRTYTHSFVYYLLKLSQLQYQQNYIPMTRKILADHEH